MVNDICVFTRGLKIIMIYLTSNSFYENKQLLVGHVADCNNHYSIGCLQ